MCYDVIINNSMQVVVGVLNWGLALADDDFATWNSDEPPERVANTEVAVHTYRCHNVGRKRNG